MIPETKEVMPQVRKKIVTIPDSEFRKTYVKSTYPVETEDGWTLVITRYKPIKQDYEQPLFNVPLLLVHGFSQNRLTWTAGEFVKNMLFFGVDVHILELRGHGRSSRELQFLLHQEQNKPLPGDIDYQWSIDSYFLYDVPAAIRAVKEKTGFNKIFYCGHSMGGMLGYCYATVHQEDLYGLITIGSPAEIGRSSMLLKVGSYIFPFSTEIIDFLVGYINFQKKLKLGIKKAKKKVTETFGVTAKLIPQKKEVSEELIEFNNIPIDEIFKELADFVRKHESLFRFIPDYLPKLWNPDKVDIEDLLYLLEKGAEKEPRKVVDQFTRWIRRNEFKIYTTDYDCRANFKNIKIPIAIIFGDEDLFANIKSTKKIYRSVNSDYLLWRPVRGNSHIELTMGADLNQISFDIKNLMEYALSHEKDRFREDRSTIK